MKTESHSVIDKVSNQKKNNTPSPSWFWNWGTNMNTFQYINDKYMKYVVNRQNYIVDVQWHGFYKYTIR